MDGVQGLYPNTPITRSRRRDGERDIISHGVEDGNDFTDRVVFKRDYYALIIGVRHHIVRIHVVEHDLIGSDQDSDGSEIVVPMLVWIDPFDGTLLGEPWMSME